MRATPLLILIVVAARSTAAAAPKPNVLLICVDDLKPALGCYGDKLVMSPYIDRLAARGVVFERAYCNQAVCAPSRNALLTGVRPTTMGIYDLGTNFRVASSNAVTLPQYFRKHGYRAEALGPDKAPARFNRFDTNKDGVLSREEFIGMGDVGKP